MIPAAWIDSLFARLQVRYGRDWSGKWEGVDIAAVKADWAAELAGFGEAPEAIAYALDNLPPDRPPTLGQFRQLCINRPEPAKLALPAPRYVHPRIAQELARLKEATKARHPLQWAYDLQAKEAAGEALSLIDRASWREALASRATDPGITFNPILWEDLPPGMQRDADPERYAAKVAADAAEAAEAEYAAGAAQ